MLPQISLPLLPADLKGNCPLVHLPALLFLLPPVPDADTRGGVESLPVEPPLEHGVDGARAHCRAHDAVGALVEALHAAGDARFVVGDFTITTKIEVLQPADIG